MSEKDEEHNDDAQDQNDDVGTDRADDDKDGADQLGDAGKKALDAMKAKWQKERDERKALAAQLAALNNPDSAKGDSAKGDGDKKDQPDPEKIREQARREARAEALRERALDKVEAKAAKLFADPEDARALLAGKVDKFIDGDELDLDAISEALEELLKKKPHLAAQGGGRFNGSADGGARKGSGKPAQLTEQDLKRMTPQQIVEAQAKGQFADLLGG